MGRCIQRAGWVLTQDSGDCIDPVIQISDETQSALYGLKVNTRQTQNLDGSPILGTALGKPIGGQIQRLFTTPQSGDIVS